MNENLSKDFLWRRLLESYSDWVIALPVLLAFVVLGLMVLFRKERRFSGMLVPFVVVTVLSAIYVPLALSFKPIFSWWVVLAPLLVVALIYVVLMYVKDAQSIHPLLAAFLGGLRCAVYAILAFVFLLPGCQTYDRTESFSKVIFLFDVSGSMNTIDGTPEISQDPTKLPTRQDLVIEALSGKAALMQKVLAKSPITAYRFGGVVDETSVIKLEAGTQWNAAQWAQWLKPDRADIEQIKFDPKMSPEDQLKEKNKHSDLIDTLKDNTNVPGSALQVAKLEGGNLIQALVIFSDGQSNTGSDESVTEFINRVNNPRRPMPVYTVGVGEYRQPASIQLQEPQVPQTARPDDKFLVREVVVGRGLSDEETQITLEVTRIEDASGKPVTGEPVYTMGPKKAVFKGAGDNPMDTVEFEIDIQALKGLKSNEDKTGELEGTWQFTAKAPRHPREAFAKKEHVTEPPARVQVLKKKLRVLLFASGPSREYQFVRTLLYREVIEKRVEMSVLLQTGRDEKNIDQDVEADRLLSRFPDHIGEGGKEKFMSLTDYDLIIAFDPDWSQLDSNQFKLLKDWVGGYSGGIIFVAGPVHTHIIARPGGIDIDALKVLYPVVPKDSRLESLIHDSSRPYYLGFTNKAKLFDFLKLDETGESPTSGWDGFFWGTGKAPEPGKDVTPLRGMFSYYPVEKVKPGATVVATFEGPERTRINDGKDAQPYIVTMPFGSGKTVYIGSAESYRLRTYKDNFHERFWIKLGRYVSAGTTQQKKYGYWLTSKNVPVGMIAVEAQLKGDDLLPMSRDARPTVFVHKIGDDSAKPITFDLKAKPTSGDWMGWFSGNVKITQDGEYELKVPIAGTNEVVTTRMTVFKPNRELDNLKHNHAALYLLSSDAKPVLDRLNVQTRKEVERALARPTGEEVKEEGKDTQKLFFLLPNAEAIPKCLVKVDSQKEDVKGRLEDLWDDGLQSGWTVNAYYLAMLVPIIVGIFGGVILLVLRQISSAAAFFGAGLLLALVVFFIGSTEWPALPVNFSYVLIAVVGLLSLEWLTRKLMKLA
ncbi:MAG: hypothetical protein HY040_25605 [Planctomycetes bacterium]|nr:hypothetical protein [Planctomycetota bacterium]